ncbi:hypothetical protein [Klebsiella pneumoniae]|uniref:hypothetical protein n=1 Tax=Klebsiella pneumoniae TaxID=573 RepID=UPI00359469EE
MTSKLTRERLEKIKSWRETYGAGSNVMLPAEEAEELARIALAAMDGEPYCKERKLFCSTDTARMRKVISVSAGSGDAPLYLHAQHPVVSADLLHTAASAIEDLLTTKDRKGAGVWFDLPFRLRSAANAQPAPVVPENCVTAEHRRVIEMLLNVCGAAFELADDSCQQDVDGEECHVVPSDAFQKLSDALDEIENTLPTEDIDRPDVFLAWSAMPRAALKSLLHAQPAPVVPELRVDWQENEFSAGWNACRAAMLAAAQQEGK